MGCFRSQKFHEHVTVKENPCATVLDGTPSFAYTLSTEYLKWNGVSSFRENDEFDLTKDQQWILVCFFCPFLKKNFYLSSYYVAAKRSFVFCVMIAEDEEVASMYNVTLFIDNSKVPKRKLTYEGPVVSIEQIRSCKNPETLNDSWCVQFEAAKPLLFVNRTSKNNNNVWTVKIPIEVTVTRDDD